jgi:hypothetical protein
MVQELRPSGREDNQRAGPRKQVATGRERDMADPPTALPRPYLRHPMRWSFPCLLLTAVLTAPAPSYAQGNIRDTPISMVMVTASYAYQVPLGDMALRYGANSNLGLSCHRKFKSNYMVGVEGSYIFGNRINESNLLRGLLTAENQVLDANGVPATVFLYERGYTVMGVVGKVIPVAGPNPNSGLLLKMGGGYMRHKIRIETQENVVPQLEGEYVKGYDRLCAGPAAMVYFGYQHLSSSRLINFNIGFEMMLGFTSALRPYNFDTGKADTGVRFDGLNGLRFGWTLPIYRRNDDAFYIR